VYLSPGLDLRPYRSSDGPPKYHADKGKGSRGGVFHRVHPLTSLVHHTDISPSGPALNCSFPTTIPNLNRHQVSCHRTSHDGGETAKLTCKANQPLKDYGKYLTSIRSISSLRRKPCLSHSRIPRTGPGYLLTYLSSSDRSAELIDRLVGR
jgi:hypothetical protein